MNLACHLDHQMHLRRNLNSDRVSGPLLVKNLHYLFEIDKTCMYGKRFAKCCNTCYNTLAYVYAELATERRAINQAYG